MSKKPNAEQIENEIAFKEEIAQLVKKWLEWQNDIAIFHYNEERGEWNNDESYKEYITIDKCRVELMRILKQEK